MGKQKGTELGPKSAQTRQAAKIAVKSKGVIENSQESPKLIRTRSKRSLVTDCETVNNEKKRKMDKPAGQKLPQKPRTAVRECAELTICQNQEKSSNNNATVDTADVQPGTSTQGQLVVGSAKSLIDSIKAKRAKIASLTKLNLKQILEGPPPSKAKISRVTKQSVFAIDERASVPADGVQVTVNSSDDDYDDEMGDQSIANSSYSSSDDNPSESGSESYSSSEEETPPPPHKSAKAVQKVLQRKEHNPDSDLDDEEIDSLHNNPKFKKLF